MDNKMIEEPYHMWCYWRDKKDYEEALNDYFFVTLKNNPQLQLALAQLQNAKVTIDAIMQMFEDTDENLTELAELGQEIDKN